LTKGIKIGILSTDYQEVVEAAWDAVSKQVDDNGSVVVSEATAVGDKEYYVTCPTGVYPCGQGAFLLAAVYHGFKKGGLG